jgi:hypothetical protein
MRRWLWPAPITLDKKLYGHTKDLKRMAEFMKKTKNPSPSLIEMLIAEIYMYMYVYMYMSYVRHFLLSRTDLVITTLFFYITARCYAVKVWSLILVEHNTANFFLLLWLLSCHKKRLGILLFVYLSIDLFFYTFYFFD